MNRDRINLQLTRAIEHHAMAISIVGMVARFLPDDLDEMVHEFESIKTRAIHLANDLRALRDRIDSEESEADHE